MAQSPASSRLSDHAKSTIRLILRSSDLGDGWRRVSPACWSLIERFAHQELIERREPADYLDGVPQTWGRVRLTERGRILADYI